MINHSSRTTATERLSVTIFDCLEPCAQWLRANSAGPLCLGRLVTPNIPADRSLGRPYSGTWLAKTVQKPSSLPISHEATKMISHGAIDSVGQAGSNQSEFPSNTPLAPRNNLLIFRTSVMSALRVAPRSSLGTLYAPPPPYPTHETLVRFRGLQQYFAILSSRGFEVFPFYCAGPSCPAQSVNQSARHNVDGYFCNFCV